MSNHDIVPPPGDYPQVQPYHQQGPPAFESAAPPVQNYAPHQGFVATSTTYAQMDDTNYGQQPPPPPPVQYNAYPQQSYEQSHVQQPYVQQPYVQQSYGQAPPPPPPQQQYMQQGYNQQQQYMQQAPPNVMLFPSNQMQPVVGQTAGGQQFYQPGPQVPPGQPQIASMKPADVNRCDYDNQTEYKDWLFAAIYGGQVLLMFILSFIYISTSDKASSSSSYFSQKFVVGVAIVMCLFGGVIGVAWVFLIRRFPESIIKMSFLFSIAFSFALAVFCFIGNNAGMGLLMLVISLLGAVWYKFIMERIPLAAQVMRIATEVIINYPGSIYVACAAVICKLAWTAYWIAIVAGIANNSSTQSVNGFVAFLLILELIWTLEVIRNVVHVTACGAAATWCFQAEVKSLTTPALKRACTTSFGSICFGSLVVAILETIRFYLRSASRRSELACVANCILGYIEALIRFFNNYAYVYVAMYGMSFRDAASAAWDLMTTRGFDTVVNDDLAQQVLSFGTLVSALLCGICGGAWAYTVNVNSQYGLWGILAMVIGGYACSTVLTSVKSAIITIWVCLAEDPKAFWETHPQDYDAIKAAVLEKEDYRQIAF